MVTQSFLPSISSFVRLDEADSATKLKQAELITAGVFSSNTLSICNDLYNFVIHS